MCLVLHLWWLSPSSWSFLLWADSGSATYRAKGSHSPLPTQAPRPWALNYQSGSPWDALLETLPLGPGRMARSGQFLVLRPLALAIPSPRPRLSVQTLAPKPPQGQVPLKSLMTTM